MAGGLQIRTYACHADGSIAGSSQLSIFGFTYRRIGHALFNVRTVMICISIK